MKARHLLAAVAVPAVVASLAACSPTTDDAGSTSSTLTLGSQVDVTSWDPAETSAGHWVQYMGAVYDTVLTVDADGAIQPNIATEWSWDDSNTELTLELRDDATFTDGTPVDAEAIALNLEHIAAGTGQGSSRFASLAEATAVDADTLTIELTEPDPGFLSGLASSSFLASPDAIEGGNLSTEPVGSGPYVYDAAASSVGSEYHFTRNQDYWNSDAYAYDSVVVMPLTDDRARLAALQSGAIDAAAGLASWVEEGGDDLEVEFNAIDWNGLFLDDRAGDIVPALGDVRVRQAINYAFDREAILETYQLGYGEVTTQVFNPSNAAYDETLNDYYTYDPDKARALLAEAGYADGFTLPMPTSDWTATTAAVVQQQLADVGITVEYETIPTTNVLARLPDFAAHKFSWQMDLDPWNTVSLLVLPDATGNYQHSSDETVETLLAQIRSGEGDTDSLYQELNAHIVEQAWFAPWYTMEQPYMHTSSVDVTVQPGSIVPPLTFFTPAS